MAKENLRIRIADEQDAEALLNIYAPYVQKTAITFEYEVPSVREFAGRIRRTLEKYPYLAAEADGEIAGYAYAGAFQERAAYGWSAEATVYVKEGMKKAGVGRKLYESLELLLQAQNILNLNACIAYPPAGDDEYLTTNSVEFHRHLGFQLVGEFHQCGYKFNRWYNMVWMEKHIGPHLELQPPIKSFQEIKDTIYLS